jgi:hypothetical protein
MAPWTSPFVLLGLLAVVFGLCIAALAWRHREIRGGRAYAVLMVTLSVWSGLYVLQLSEPTVTGKRTWLIARNTVSPLTGVLFWVFAARYTDRTTLLSPRVLAVIVVPGAAVALLPSTAPDLF